MFYFVTDLGPEVQPPAGSCLSRFLHLDVQVGRFEPKVWEKFKKTVRVGAEPAEWEWIEHFGILREAGGSVLPVEVSWSRSAR